MPTGMTPGAHQQRDYFCCGYRSDSRAKAKQPEGEAVRLPPTTPARPLATRRSTSLARAPSFSASRYSTPTTLILIVKLRYCQTPDSIGHERAESVHNGRLIM